MIKLKKHLSHLPLIPVRPSLLLCLALFGSVNSFTVQTHCVFLLA